jgi:deoxyribonuclease-4
MSIAGGYHNALLSAKKYACEAVQIFTKNANQWRAKELTDPEIQTFKDTLGQTKVQVLLAHDSYLINLASPGQALFRQSLEAFVIEVQRAERLGLTYLVTHPGAHVGSGEADGLRRVAEALDEVHQRCPSYNVKVLLETTAGMGSCLGHRFEHLARILELVAQPERVGVCLDTCHVFAAGYALAPEKKYRATMNEFDQIVGLHRLHAFHLNDSQKPLGSRIDRHAHIGKGCLGLEPFRLFVGDRRFRQLPMILETPKELRGKQDMDSVNLRTLRNLVASAKNQRPMTKNQEPRTND